MLDEMLITADLPQQTGNNAGKPWSLYGREAEIHQLKSEGNSYDKIARDLGATKQGVIGAHKRYLKEAESKKATPEAEPPQ